MASRTAEQSYIRIIVLVLAVLVLLPFLLMAFSWPMMGMMGWMWGPHMGGGGFRPLWGLGTMLVWLLILGGIGYGVYRVAIGALGHQSGDDPALAELRLAYVRGDLSDEEFEERRQRLAKDRD